MARERGTPGRGLVIAWHLLATVILFLVPSRIVLGEPAWAASAERLPALLGLPLCYLASALFLLATRRAGAAPGLVRSLTTLAVALSAFFLALLLAPGTWYSRGLVLGGYLLAVLFITAPLVIPRVGPVLALAVLLLVGVDAMPFPRGIPRAPVSADAGAPTTAADPDGAGTSIRSNVLLTARGPVKAVTYSGYLPTPSAGGGIRALGDGYVVATGDGDLYRLRWPEDSDSLEVTALPIRVPLNREDFAAAVPADIRTDLFRVAHILLRPVADSLQIVASHHYWKGAEQCFVVRISTLTIARDELERAVDALRWRTLYDTRPCLRLKDHERGWPFNGSQVGGRLADLGDGRLLVTTGDHEFDGWNSKEILSQDPSADYGKVLVVEPDGTAERLTMGHRNPQGLHIDSSGRIWVTDHGPKGGDLLHEIVPGSNYGWPYFTYGTEYGLTSWPLIGKGDLDPASYRRPAFAWVPSIGISNLIEIRRGPLEDWRGDLLIAALTEGRLFRVRREGGRVAYVEPVGAGARIRDLVEGSDGRIVLWADEGGIIAMTAQTEPDGAMLFARCAGCHSRYWGQPSGVGPNLFGLVGRPIGGAEGFTYSSALAGRTGRWTDESLDAFLADPQGFAPGTSMAAEPVTDPEERASLIEYLKTLR